MLAVLSVPVAEGIDVEAGKTREIKVEVKGEGLNPGIYTLPAYSNLSDLLELTELSDQADVSNLNDNLILKDNDVIIIPDRIEENGKISINTGDLRQLDSVPGIGPVTAQSIIDYRNANGLFQSLEELTRVRGIGEKTLEKIREYISL
ncbi:MAG: ComEA family DNA-binding protein [Erysipelotrichaceae bacterium]|nr:ComEA family DNA-binding protein [Erysipelotrichaceae bacterium]